MLKVNTLTGFGGGGAGPVTIVGTATNNVFSTDQPTHALGNIDVGSASGDKNIILGLTWSDADTRTVSAFTVGGVSLTERATVNSGGTEKIGAAIWTGDISSIAGSQAISVTFSGNCSASGVSGAAISGLQSLIPTMSDTDSNTSSAQLIITSLAAPASGIVFACAGTAARTAGATYGSLTERSDLPSDGGSPDHRHSAAWDLGVHTAANETIDHSSGTERSAAGAGFR